MTEKELVQMYNYKTLCTKLKKENAELEDKLTEKVTLESLDVVSARIKGLEKENAELKGLVNQYKASKCGSISLVNRNMIMFDQLTKAKDLLKQWLSLCGFKVEKLAKDTEQFLNSEVEK